MTGALITLPLRLGARGAGLLLQVTETAASRAWTLTGLVVDLWRSRSDEPPAVAPEGTRQRAKEKPQQRVRQPPTGQGPAPPEQSPESPPHVSEEPVLVEEVAEPGAEDGAGAAVTVEEPWEGYARMTAREVIARLSGATQAELGAVKLYENAHRHRQTVLAAVDREMRTAASDGSPD